MMPTSMVFGWEICLPFNLLFGAALDKEKSTNDHMTDLIQWLQDIQQYAYQHSDGAQ
jgi:hypothetical protein